MWRRTMSALPLVAALASTAEPARGQEGHLAVAGGDLAVLEGYLAAWNAHDPDRAASFMAEDVTYYDTTVGEPRAGRAAVRDEVVAALLAAVPDLTLTVRGEPVARPGAVAFEWTLAGTNTGAWSAEVPATGRPLRLEGATVVHLENGKIVYQGDYYDGFSFQRQMGWAD